MDKELLIELKLMTENLLLIYLDICLKIMKRLKMFPIIF